MDEIPDWQFKKEVIESLATLKEGFASFCRDKQGINETLKDHEERIIKQELNWTGLTAKIGGIMAVIIILWNVFGSPLLAKFLNLK